MTEQNILRNGIKIAWQATLALGVLSILMGIVIVAWPGPTTLVIGILFGIFLLVSGAFQIVAGLVGEARHRVLAVISGALSVILGVLAFNNDVINSIAILGIWIGVGWIFAGITQIVAGVSDAQLAGRVWIVILGVLTLIGGCVLVSNPFAVGVVVWVVGLWAIAIGVIQIIAALQMRSAVRHLDDRSGSLVG